jgi:dTDP-4-amino-4,6-dideoxygalactose transaminase
MVRVEFFKHNIGPEEKWSVSEVLGTVFLTTGDTVARFEEVFAEYIGADACIGLTSCTAALHLSLLALGIGPGDEVITTPMTFVATSLAILHAGATPVWVDVEPGTGNLNAELIEDAITERTKAILPVHLYGQMCDMKRIRAIADRHRLFIIEDAAHALEGWRDGIRVGELSDAACFSFYATKSITCGEGGAVTTNSTEVAEKIRILRLHGIDTEAADRYTRKYRHWDLMDIGWKYNMDNIQAALLLPQLRRVDTRWKRRREIAFRYRERLSSIPGLRMPAVADATDHAYHLFTIWVDPDSRDEIIARLQQRGVGVAVNYRSINLLSKFQERFGKGRGSYPESERIGDSTISLPLYPRLTDEEVEYVISSVKDIVSSSDYSHADHIHRYPQALVQV